VHFDPFTEGELRKRFIETEADARPAVLANALRDMVDGLRGISLVVDLANVDEASFETGLRQALGEEPANLTASRALSWLLIRDSRFCEARSEYEKIESHWSNYGEIFIEHIRTLIIEDSLEEAQRVLLRHSKFFSPAGFKSYLLQCGGTHGPQKENECFEAVLLHGARTFRDLVSPTTPIRNQIKESEWLAVWSAAENLCKANSIALVGNGSSLRGASNGSKIDDHDLVVRCNFPQISAHVSDVGARTDLIIFNESVRSKLISRHSEAQQFSKTLSIGVHPEPSFGIPTDSFFDTLSNVGTLPGGARKFISDVCYSRSTTGLMAINLLTIVFNKRVNLFGFDFFGNMSMPHYFGTQVGAYLGHELQYEQWYVRDFLIPRLCGQLAFG
jgi:hypothetical protein